MYLREYLYVDTDKVAGLASQLYDGMPERATNLAARRAHLGIDVKLFDAGRSKSTEDSTERNLADTVFKDLELDLEALGLLEDVSEDLATSETWTSLGDLVRPGQILRITAPGSLFHAAQLSGALINMATAAHGLSELSQDDAPAEAPVVPPRAKPQGQKKTQKPSVTPVGDRRFPEDDLPLGDVVPYLNLPRAQLSGIIKLVRGIFAEGMHLHQRPRGIEGPIVSARLEAGRRFLDSSPEILFSRYGLSEQQWTVVGVVGQTSNQDDGDFDFEISNDNGTLNRAKLVKLVNELLVQTEGFVDLPQGEGFTLVPIAVYRGLGNPIADS